ncbi:MAG: Holliday junction resolvase RuvX [Desulfitobacteriaceae bacterium]|nr:Holliday junction resolvase RuvX [Desulfitobacteriaceae bacterium]MDI6878018.1 Holliday junction resolvase RuvX [Desulfitobacteriaceae bacterium]MDI6914189.1 Holliday junction resolvase RuvX [Desulfitobacteriaceae bacterium]
MRIMGLDFGERTIGVAVSDELLWTAQGILTIRRSSKDMEMLENIIREYAVEIIVLGYPKNMNGTTGPRAEKTKKFAQKLKEKFALPVELWDERLSTVAAQRTLLEGDVSRAKRKKVVDKMAAVFILQGYLDRRAHLSESDV